MSLPTLYRGGNRLLARTLRLADGETALPVASLAGAKAILMQGGTVCSTAILGTDAQIHVGATEDELVLEITSAVTAAMRPGVQLDVVWLLKLPDAAFVVEPDSVFIDVIKEAVAEVL